jgi:hypothetical protein
MVGGLGWRRAAGNHFVYAVFTRQSLELKKIASLTVANVYDSYKQRQHMQCHAGMPEHTISENSALDGCNGW